MEAYYHDWLSLILRWSHMITGIAWIGASFYFNWLENHLQRQQADNPGIAGDLWAIHGGGFYHLTKFAVAPDKLPSHLHWFKWEAYATWLTGVALLIVVYYWNANIFMAPAGTALFSEPTTLALAFGSLIISWMVYDLLCTSRLAAKEPVLALLIGSWFVFLAWALGEFLNGRAAFIHVGAAIGTIMVANVFRVIIPSQKALVEAVSRNQTPDPAPGKKALQRSRHNNYFTLPVLFIMISGHYPITYGHEWNWLVLTALALAGVFVRHYFNTRHLGSKSMLWLVAGAGLLALVIFLMRPAGSQPLDAAVPQVTTSEAFAVVQTRCMTCHAAEPGNAAFPKAPLGIELDSMDKLRLHAERVYNATVITRTMPLGNLTQMTDRERHLIANWFEGSQQKKGGSK